ncbi:Uma2 family endonuclease [Actinomadura namibiensis]|uniref:Uma2 family endonuclease n=1 Tax=Actinomadura namibiensis TaxID=182080 RepID=A0A7W3LMM2_ACTNM|nr:Uma2 family endonuclease [Actinomadura namibiensis]MBA8950931.1 Uma2 family endonuclease [Actinomadura namibiensis]
MARTVVVSDRLYTIHDLLELNEERWPRFEVLGGTLMMSPAPAPKHQIFGDNLQTLLTVAAPRGEAVITASHLRLCEDETGMVPDLLVLHPGVNLERTYFEAEDVLAAVEVVSPGNHKNDRIVKAIAYAEAGIPFYWRVELAPFPGQGEDRLPVVLVQEHTGDGYREVERLTAGSVGNVTRPFPLSIDPAVLLDPAWQRTLLSR